MFFFVLVFVFGNDVKQLNRLQASGVVGRTGVCDLSIRTLEALHHSFGTFPQINQVNFRNFDRELMAFAKTNGIQLLTYTSTGNGEKE
jgi:diketogulonate reductase-like aldo/keto reductase